MLSSSYAGSLCTYCRKDSFEFAVSDFWRIGFVPNASSSVESCYPWETREWRLQIHYPNHPLGYVLIAALRWLFSTGLCQRNGVHEGALLKTRDALNQIPQRMCSLHTCPPVCLGHGKYLFMAFIPALGRVFITLSLHQYALFDVFLRLYCSPLSCIFCIQKPFNTHTRPRKSAPAPFS